MLFNSLQFAVFLPIVFALYWTVPKTYRWAVLTVSGYVFYMFGGAKYAILLALVTLVTYFGAIGIEQNKSQARMILLGTLLFNFGILFVYKYFNFFSVSLMSLFRGEGFTLDLVLPAGISFYTFGTAAYVIDVYQGKMKPLHHLGLYAAYVSYFPKLLAGPIERIQPFIRQLRGADSFSYEDGMYGVYQMVWGFFKKMVIADTLAKYVNLVYGDVHGYGGGALLAASVMYMIQIYCDFSGYSDIAMGVSRLFGIRLSDNFLHPYSAVSIQDFWRRWHISLSSWFRDYLYIPLGGNRKGKLRTYLNTVIVFMVSGLWHGAAWTYIFWGLIHGIAQVFERILKRGKKREVRGFARVLCHLGVWVFLLITWIFFRADTLSDAFYVLTHLFSGIVSPVSYAYRAYSQLGIDSYTLLCIPYMLLCLLVFEVLASKKDPLLRLSEMGPKKRFVLCLFFMFMFLMVLPVRSSNEFLYFKF